MSNHYFTNRARARLQGDAKGRKPRPRTFKTEEAATKYAKEKGIAKFSLKNMHNATKKSKKLRIIPA